MHRRCFHFNPIC